MTTVQIHHSLTAQGGTVDGGLKRHEYQNHGDQIIDRYCGTTLVSHNRIHRGADGSRVSTYQTYNARGQAQCHSLQTVQKDGSVDRVDRTHNKMRHFNSRKDGQGSDLMVKVSDLDRNGQATHYRQTWNTAGSQSYPETHWQRDAGLGSTTYHSGRAGANAEMDYRVRDARGQLFSQSHVVYNGGPLVETSQWLRRPHGIQTEHVAANGDRIYGNVSPDGEFTTTELDKGAPHAST
jgi:hypothetical protein